MKNENWIKRQTATPEARRLYEQERLVLWTTEHLCSLMDEMGITRAELAERLGTSRANITSLLSGSRNMTLRTLSDVAFVLGFRMDTHSEPLRPNCYITTPARIVRTTPLSVKSSAATPLHSGEGSAAVGVDGRETLAA